MGGLIGWVGSRLMDSAARQGMVLNVVVGVIGALLAGWLITPLVGGAAINGSDFSFSGLSVSGLVISLLGAIVVLSVVNLFRHGGVR